jgi:hypothetical protein
METRINEFGQREAKIQPKGLPAIWVELFCDRCRKYQDCLGFKELSETEWEEVNAKISSPGSFALLKLEFKKNFLPRLNVPCR